MLIGGQAWWSVVEHGGAWWSVRLLVVVQSAGAVCVDSAKEMEYFLGRGVLFQAHRHEQLRGGGEGARAGGREIVRWAATMTARAGRGTAPQRCGGSNSRRASRRGRR